MSDLISRQAAIDAIEHITSSMSVCVNTDECHGMKRMQRQAVIELANLPSAQPGIKLESAIDYLHSIGWMQEHDRTLTESAQSDCTDCKKHGGDLECDYVHCHKGEQPDNDMIHLQKEQAYLQGWEEGRKALKEETRIEI